MARAFSPGTAEHVIEAVGAVAAFGKAVDAAAVATFTDLPLARVQAALELATDIGFLRTSSGKFRVSHPLSRYMGVRNDAARAAALRVMLEDYSPFVIFQERLRLSGDAAASAQQTRAILELSADRDQVQETLVSLGTYSHALKAEGGGRYTAQSEPLADAVATISAAASNHADALARIRHLLGDDSAERVSRDNVLEPLANALVKANTGDPRGAVLEAGNAVESFLVELARTRRVSVAGASGITQKVDRFAMATVGGKGIPMKLRALGACLGHVRNAADHGLGDPDVTSPWGVRDETGSLYVHMACSFISGVLFQERGETAQI